MPTTKSRINISLPDLVSDTLIKSALRDRIPTATKAAKLLEAALEMEEDQIWDGLAIKRDTADAQYLSHAKAWNLK